MLKYRHFCFKIDILISCNSFRTPFYKLHSRNSELCYVQFWPIYNAVWCPPYLPSIWFPFHLYIDECLYLKVFLVRLLHKSRVQGLSGVVITYEQNLSRINLPIVTVGFLHHSKKKEKVFYDSMNYEFHIFTTMWFLECKIMNIYITSKLFTWTNIVLEWQVKV